MPYVDSTELMTRLLHFQDLRRLPGLNAEESRKRFVEKVINSQNLLRAIAAKKFGGSADPHKKDFRPLKAIVELFEKGECDEAVWLAFLTIHFGQDRKKTVGLFYGKFGEGRWDWDAVSQKPDAVRLWMALHQRQLQHLKFGNHRKHETNKPESPKGTAAVVMSFVRWVQDNGQGKPYKALRAVSSLKSPELCFDAVYEKFSAIRFGRTAKFDFLCLLGTLGILDVSPPHCYLREATGPRYGALLMVTGKKKGRITQHVDGIIRKLQKHLGVPSEVIEDALCNWQKRAQSMPRAPELGYVTTTCS